MSSSTYVGNPDVMVAGPPPPPPPPPPMSGQLPAMRINTAESAATKRPQMGSNDAYEPPAAIQNAMLTKDKKPFTYTPGMGGKLDLSQIRSPRMARRVAKNANDEGIEGPPKSALESKPSPAASIAPNPFVQPQVAIPVFPTNVPPQPPVNRVSQPATVNRTPSNVADKQAEAPKTVTKIDTKIVPITVTSSQSSTPESPNTPTQITLAKAPTPWLQNKNKPQEELPEWAKRASVNIAAVSPSESPESPTSPVYIQVQPPLRQTPPQRTQPRQKEHEQQQPTQQSAQYQPPPQYQPKPQQVPQSPQPQTPSTWQPRQNTESAVPQRTNPQTHQHERVIPIRIEDRPSVFDAKRESGHHQFKQPSTLHHQQRWGQGSAQQPQSPESQIQNRPLNQPQTHVVVVSRPEQTVGTYIIPIVVEGNDKKTSQSNVAASNATEKGPKVVQQKASVPVQQHETGPVQSKSFRVLQKITDTDTSNDVGTDQIRRMELSEDERVLMNKFKEQVDHETYLHQEEDPRYRGAAIPSRAFRYLQNMTDSTDASVTCAAPARNAQNVANKRQNRNSKSFEETQANLPPSEQQVPEPKKYMGSAIPSRSFRILQAMTAPESIATQENRQADYTRRTENNLPGNQQGVFLPPSPVPFWYPEGWWGYYPAVQYSAPYSEPAGEANKHSFPPYAYPDGNVYVGYDVPFYPLYDQNLADLARVKVTRLERPSSAGRDGLVYPGQDRNGHHQRSYVDANGHDDHDHRLPATDSSFAPEDKCIMRSDPIDNESGDAVLPEEINHLDAQSSGAHGPKYHQRADVGENDDDVDRNDIVTAMNIVGEESRVPDNRDNNAAPVSTEPTLEKTFGLHINVPNYTYVDTSDSSDDSSDDSNDSSSASDNEQLSDSRRKVINRNDDTTSSNNNSSSDSDSDSYVAYSTGLNPHEKPERETSRRASAGFPEDNHADPRPECSTSAENRDRAMDDPTNGDKSRFRNDRCRHSEDFDSRGTFERDITAGYSENHHPDGRSTDLVGFSTDKRNSSDRESDAEQATIDDSVPGQLNITDDDMERQESENPCHEGRSNVNGQEEAVFEATDDPPDDSEATMVSVSLPLRFKFFVSENNEDVTTVIVGDSKIRTERPHDAKIGRSVENDEVNDDDVSVDFHVGNDTSVDFTIKRHASSDDAHAMIRGDTGDKTDSNVEVTIPQVNFTLRKDLTKSYGTSCKESTETKSTTTTTEHDKMSSAGSASSDDDDDNDNDDDDHVVSEPATPARDHLAKDENYVDVVDSVRDNFELRISAVPESPWTRDDLEKTPQVRVVDTSGDNKAGENNGKITCDKEKEHRYLEPEVKQTTSETKRLLSVQDSREDTDEDEDSGVTSDLSRMISEVDTDSECTSSAKNSKKYQRTQTHSRLFRLLNDDSIQESSDRKADPASRKEYLSLPLNTNTNTVFNYDDSYCSNYSSGLTSPEYSPIHESSWRRFHDASFVSSNGLPNARSYSEYTTCPQSAEQVAPPPAHKDDPYFHTWKNSRPAGLHDGHEVVPSLAHKILDSRMPSWAYKVNVLCPRIKSTKSVPRALTRNGQTHQAASRPGKINDSPSSTVPPIPSTSCANANANYC